MIDRLYEAAGSGDVNLVKTLLGNKLDPNALHSKYKKPPLARAIKKGNLEIVKTLIASGARINYAEKKEKSPIRYIIQNKEWKEILIYLMEKGLKIDPGLMVEKNYYDKGCSLLWWIGEKNEWDLLLSIMMENNSLSIDGDLFTFIPSHRQNWRHSLLNNLFEHSHSKTVTAIVNQLLIRFILTSTPKNFSELKVDLNTYVNHLAACVKHELQTNVKKKFSAQIAIIEKLYTELSHSVLNSSYELSDLNKLGRDIRFLIANKIASSYLKGIQEDFCTKLVNLFNQFKLPVQPKLKTVATLAFREWRHNHQDLFLFQAPTNKAIHDIHNCLIECLSQKMPIYQVPAQLRKHIIEEIAKLESNDFNKPNFLQAIDKALVKWEGQSNSNIYPRLVQKC